MAVGKIKWYSAHKGYGLILENSGREIYFHYTAVAESGVEMQAGLSVSYDLIETRMGLEAANVRRAAPAFV
jgi:CspA family cold shock protein